MTKMQHLTSFVFGLLVIVHALGQFITDAHQGQEGLSMRGKVLTDQKELIDHGTSIAGSRMIGLGGRRMVAHTVLRRLKPVRPAELNGETSSTSSKNSGATRSSDGNCDFEGKGDLNVKCIHGDHDKSNTSTASAKKYFKASHDFVAFGADYRGPARHPPKHN